jgi:hypothetical protein
MPLRVNLRRYRHDEEDDLYHDDGRPDPESISDETDAEMTAMVEEFDRIAQRDDDGLQEAFRLIEVIRKSLEEPKAWDPHENEPLAIAEACCLPELGGKLYENHEGVPSRHITAKVLYEEIKAGRLKRVPPFRGGKFLVSRRTIKEWTEWQEDVSLPESDGSHPSTRKKASSGRTDTGRSSMARSELAQASALSLVQTLRKPASTTK